MEINRLRNYLGVVVFSLSIFVAEAQDNIKNKIDNALQPEPGAVSDKQVIDAYVVADSELGNNLEPDNISSYFRNIITNPETEIPYTAEDINNDYILMRELFWNNSIEFTLTLEDLNFLSKVSGLKLNLKGIDNKTDVSSLVNLVSLSVQDSGSFTDISKLKELKFLVTNEKTKGSITELKKLKKLFCNSPELKGSINNLLELNTLNVSTLNEFLSGSISALQKKQKAVEDKAVEESNRTEEGRIKWKKNSPYPLLKEIIFSGGNPPNIKE